MCRFWQRRMRGGEKGWTLETRKGGLSMWVCVSRRRKVYYAALRTMSSVAWTGRGQGQEGEGGGTAGGTVCCLEISGQAFLWHMVRCVMAVLLLVGKRLEKPEVRGRRGRWGEKDMPCRDWVVAWSRVTVHRSKGRVSGAQKPLSNRLDVMRGCQGGGLPAGCGGAVSPQAPLFHGP